MTYFKFQEVPLALYLHLFKLLCDVCELFFGVIFAFLDPDSDAQVGLNPDPKHCPFVIQGTFGIPASLLRFIS